MRINQNISAMNTYSRLTAANTSKSNSLAKLSSGLRINKAGDDAAGLAISEKMRGQVGGLNQAVRNAQDGISLIQTAEGALNETHSILQRMRDLSVQSSNDTNTNADRLEIQKEIDQLSTEITRIAETTEFNTQNLLGGDFKAKFHIGANESQNMELKISDMSSKELETEGTKKTISGATWTISSREGADIATIQISVSGATGTKPAVTSGTGRVIQLASGSKMKDIKEAMEKEGFEVKYNGAAAISTAAGVALASTSGVLGATQEVKTETFGINVTTQKAANSAITKLDDAIANVSSERSKLGAVQNRLDHTINNLTATSENLSAAESRIRDVDMAEEMMEFTKNNILSQAATSMLAQANQMPQSVLQLLQ